MVFFINSTVLRAGPMWGDRYWSKAGFDFDNNRFPGQSSVKMRENGRASRKIDNWVLQMGCGVGAVTFVRTLSNCR
ncbi:MAG: hypothetical protein ABSF53_27125, partial [Terracidiphilus sp.]